MDQKAILEALAACETEMMELCANGVRTSDECDRSLEIIDLLMRIDKPIVAQRLSPESLVLTVGKYEDEHYPFGY